MATSRYITGPDGALVEAPTAETVVLDSDYTTKGNLQDAFDELATGRSLPLPARSTETVSAGYPSVAAIGSGAANYGNGVAAAWWLSYSSYYSYIRQEGSLVGVRLYMPNDLPAAVDHVYVDVWRRVGSSSVRLLGSVDITAQLASGVCDVTFATPLDVASNDWLGWHFTTSGGAAGADWMTLNTGITSPASYMVASNIAKVDGETYVWTNQTPTTTALSMAPIMQAPDVVAIGDSITGYTYDNAGPLGIGGMAAIALGLRAYQVVGFPGNTAAQVAARFDVDVVAKKPRAAIIGVGVNDVSSSTADATFKAAWTSILGACQAAGIVPIVWAILPFNSGTTEQMQQRDAWNTWLAATVVAYGGWYADPNPYVGVFRSGGDADNLWDWQPALSSDGTHPNLAAKRLIARAIAEVVPVTINGALTAGAVSVGTEIMFDGRTMQYRYGGMYGGYQIGVRRQSLTDTPYEEIGPNLTIEAGGALIGKPGLASLIGGSLFLNGGEGLGWRGSEVYICPAAGQSTQATPNRPAPLFRFGLSTAASPFTHARVLWFADDNTAAAYTNGIYATAAALRSTGAFRADGGYQSADGTAGVSGTLVQDDGATARLTTVVKNGLITSVTVAASTGAEVTWTPPA